MEMSQNAVQTVFFYITAALAISVVLNLFLKRLGISQVIGYIATGTIIAYAFDLRHLNDSRVLAEVAEFGIVFLMFTIGLELSLSRLRALKQHIFFNGGMQVLVTAGAMFLLVHRLFGVELVSSVIIAMALSLSSTAVVLSYLKHSKEIHLPYGQRSMGILVFQDIAVIPMLLLIGLLQNRHGDPSGVLLQTLVSFVIVLAIFLVARRFTTWVLRVGAESGEEELFIGLVLVLAVGASLAAHEAGFTYSLGAFLAGMAIAETKYLHKVEADMAPFRDLLLGTFFVSVGLKIDLGFFLEHWWKILAMLAVLMAMKALIIFVIVRLHASRTVALETALSLAQLGEFSFAIFALANNAGLLDPQLEQMLIMMVAFSLLITPFYLSRVHPLVSRLCCQEEPHEDLSPLSERRNHVIVCGYGIVGKIVARDLRVRREDYVVIDISLKHVREGLDRGEPVYLGDLSKKPVAEAISLENARAVIVTLDNPEKKRLICETVLEVNPKANLVVKIQTLGEKQLLADLEIPHIVDSKREVAHLLVDQALRGDDVEARPVREGTPLM